jgi:hypothetical protein
MEIHKIGVGVDWIHQAQDGVQWLDVSIISKGVGMSSLCLVLTL